MKSVLSLAAVITLTTSVALAALPGLENFESYSDGASLTSPWAAVNVAVSNSLGFSSSKGAYFSASAAATNTIGEAATTAWTEFRMNPALGAQPNSPDTASSAVLFYFNAAGYITYHNGSDWVVASNGLQGVSLTPIGAGATARVGIYQNFTQNEYALFLNGDCIAQDVPFPAGDKSSYAAFVVQNVDSNAVLDNLDIVAASTSLTEANTADMTEMNSNGYIARTLYVGGNGTSEYPAYSTLTAAVAVARSGDTINIASGYATTDEAVTISSGSELTALTFSGAAFQVASLTTDGVTLTLGQNVTVSGAFTMNAAVTANGTLTFGSLDMDAALTANQNVTLSGSGTLDMDADLTLASGKNLNVSSGTIDIGSSATLTVVSGDIDADTLTMAAGTTIDVTTGTLTETTASTDLTGTFQITGADWSNWGGSTILAQSLPMLDSFENYTVDTPLQNLGLFGWGASASTVKIQNTVKVNGNAVILPDGTSASNVISDAATAVWTTFYLQPSLGVASADTPPVSDKSFVSYVNTNGNMVIAEGGQWVVCTNNLASTPAAAPTLSASAFTRIAIYQNFTTDKFALFIENDSDKLVAVKQGIAIPDTDLSTYAAFVVENSNNNAYFDDVQITTYAPSGSDNIDGDDLDDTTEMNIYGSLDIYPGGIGTIFRFI